MATTTKHQRRYKKRDSNDRFVLLYAVHQALCQSDFGIYTLSQATMRGGPEPTYDYRWGSSLDTQVDLLVLNGNIVAYKIELFSGSWSSWLCQG